MKMVWKHFEKEVYSQNSNRDILEINSYGHAGVLTCWNKPSQGHKAFLEYGIDINPNTSPIVAIAHLYGRGLPHLFRNLLFNPQITKLLLVGADLSGSGQFLKNLIEGKSKKIEREGHFYWQHTPTGQVILADFPLEILQERIEILFPSEKNKKKIAVAALRSSLVLKKSKEFLSKKNLKKPQFNRWKEELKMQKRLDLPLPEVFLKKRPGVTKNIIIIAKTVPSSFVQLLRHVTRARETETDDRGVERLILKNVTIEIENPNLMTNEELEHWNLSRSTIRRPCVFLKEDPLASDIAYFYGHRIRKHFGFDQLKAALEFLRRGNDLCLIKIWDEDYDPNSAIAKPCLTSIVLKTEFGKLDIRGNFRKHNLADAWLTNIHDLILFQKHIAQELRLKVGKLKIVDEILSLRTQNPEVVNFLTQKSEEFDLSELAKLSSPKPKFAFKENMDRDKRIGIWTGNEHVYGEWHQSLDACLHELYKLLTKEPEDPKLNPFRTLADAAECGRLLEVLRRTHGKG